MNEKRSDLTFPLVLTLGFDARSFEKLSPLRERYFPAERNLVPVHLSLFHQLPYEHLGLIADRLRELTVGISAPRLHFAGVFRLGGGVAVRVESPSLITLRQELQNTFQDWLIPQDLQPFKPHVTLMNKVSELDAATAYESIRSGWAPWHGVGDQILLWQYLNGPWKPVSEYPFG